MKVLLTSFDVWLAHHQANASDQLLERLIQGNLCPENYHLLRKIEVDFQQAPQRVIEAIRQLQPDLIICCGMAETRNKLSLESNGTCQGKILRTPLDLPKLLQGTIATEISHDAGAFVCNHLYYSVLNYIHENTLESRCLFVHVPLLHEENLDIIVQDFLVVIQNLLFDQFLTTTRSLHLGREMIQDSPFFQ